jgi:hypothetical protein
MTITELRAYRVDLETTLKNIVKTGSSGTIPGGFTFQNWTIPDIRAEISRTDAKIARLQGVSTRRVKPNFND